VPKKYPISEAVLACLGVVAFGIVGLLLAAFQPDWEGKYTVVNLGFLIVGLVLIAAGIVGVSLVYISTQDDVSTWWLKFIQRMTRDFVDVDSFKPPPPVEPEPPPPPPPTEEELKAQAEARARARKEAEAKAYEERREKEREDERRKAQAAKERHERDLEFDIQMRMARDLLTLEQIQKWRSEQRRRVHEASISPEEKEERLEQVERTVDREKDRLRHDAEIFEEEE
jgi:type IV secretory pathway VirB10-like protein